MQFSAKVFLILLQTHLDSPYLQILGVFPIRRLSLVEYPPYSGFVKPLLQVNNMSRLALASAICWFLRKSPSSESVEVHSWAGRSFFGDVI
jgi:hypothetical protein